MGVYCRKPVNSPGDLDGVALLSRVYACINSRASIHMPATQEEVDDEFAEV